MRVQKNFKYTGSNFISLNNKLYWVRSAFLRFSFYKNRRLHRNYAYHSRFGLFNFIKSAKLINISNYSNFTKRFIFSFFLISPFFWTNQSLKNFWNFETTHTFFFYKHTLYCNSFIDVLRDFNTSYYSNHSLSQRGAHFAGQQLSLNLLSYQLFCCLNFSSVISFVFLNKSSFFFMFLLLYF